MERRLSSTITEKSKYSKKFLKNEKELQDQKVAHRFFENLSQKRRFWAIVARKFYRVVASTDELAPAKFLCAKDKVTGL